MQTLEALSRRIATTERLRELDAAGTRRQCLAVGARAEARLTALGEVMDEGLVLPGSVSGLSALAQAVLVQIDAWGAVEGQGRMLLIHHRRTSEAVAVPHRRQLLPLSPERLSNLAARPWPSRRLPTFTLGAERLFPAVIRQYLFSAVYPAAAESLASEHASRLASILRSAACIEEHLKDQQAEFRRRRQEAITEEMPRCSPEVGCGARIADAFWLAAGLAVIIKGGGLFVSASVRVAESLRLPRVVIGSTLVSLAAAHRQAGRWCSLEAGEP
jgi:alternate F1F0 ATPase F1 subunit gamma